MGHGPRRTGRPPGRRRGRHRASAYVGFGEYNQRALLRMWATCLEARRPAGVGPCRCGSRRRRRDVDRYELRRAPTPAAGVDAATHHDVATWLTWEAQLLDERRLREWLSLLADDIRYRMPVTRHDGTGDRRPAGGAMDHFDEDRYSLGKRVERLEGEHAWTEDPPSRHARFVSNVRVAPIDGTDDVEARSYVLLYRSRGDDRASRPGVGRSDRRAAPRRRRAGAGAARHRHRRGGAAHPEPRPVPVNAQTGRGPCRQSRRVHRRRVGHRAGRGRRVRRRGRRVAVLELDPAKCGALSDFGDSVVAVPGDATTRDDNESARRRRDRAVGSDRRRRHVRRRVRPLHASSSRSLMIVSTPRSTRCSAST